ncbi:thioredoxin [Imleria badia]|nr:thioredoxin [Imleria badia]
MPVSVNEIKSKEEFDTLINSGKVILIDFYADWCGPCRQISSTFKSLAEEHSDKEGAEFYKLDIDKVPEIATALSIRSIPTFHVYKNKERLGQFVGANRAELRSLVSTHVSA